LVNKLELKLELIFLFSVVCVVLAGFNFKLAYGLAGSLEELQNEVNNGTRYRTELETYLLEHNMSKSEETGTGLPTTPAYEIWVPLQYELIIAQETALLESIVKEHMELCKKPFDGKSENIIRFHGGGDSIHERGIQLNNAFLKGDCNPILSKAQVEQQQAYVDKMRVEEHSKEKQRLIDNCTKLKVQVGSDSTGAVCDEVLRLQNMTTTK
jgi:hypothetical protein